MNLPLPLLARSLLVIAWAAGRPIRLVPTYTLCMVLSSLLAATGSVGAKTLEVASADGLARALAAVQPGDEVVLREGRYRGSFTLANSGDAARPITIRAAQPQQAVFERTLFDLNGNHAVLTGFVFERSQVTLRGDHNRVGHCVFRFSDNRPAGMQAAVRTLGGASHNRIHHNEVTAWSTYGLRVMQITERTTGNRIDHNYLHDYENLRSGNEPEAIQINGSNPGSNLAVGTIIEHNLVERVKITGELLSLKCSGNVVRANTFVDTQGSIQGRHGRNNAFLDNTLIGGGPLRAYGDLHRLIGNHLVGADLVVPVGSVLQDNLSLPNGRGGHPAARHQLVAANVVEGGGRIVVGKVPGGPSRFPALPAQDTTLAGNVGPLELEGPECKHSGTKVLPAYDGDPGKPFRMTREQVGPGAPDPLLAKTAIGSATGWAEDFSHGMANWWSEGGERIWTEHGRLNMSADAPKKPGGGVATTWCRNPLPADFELELEAHVTASSIAANNINLFFSYSDPSGQPLEETRAARASAAYNLYHRLNGYIVTFLNEGGKARIRLRRNPGFVLLAERHEGECRADVTYRLNVRKRGGEIVFAVDGRELGRINDPNPWGAGLLGLRSYRTELWWDNVRVRPLDGTAVR